MPKRKLEFIGLTASEKVKVRVTNQIYQANRYADWVETSLFPLYQMLMTAPCGPTSYGAGSKPRAVAWADKNKPPSELRNRIIAAIHVLILHRKNKYIRCGSKHQYIAFTEAQRSTLIYHNRQCATWLSQRGWEDEIPKTTTGKPKADKSACSCGAEGTVMTGDSLCCDRCWSAEFSNRQAKIIRDKLRRIGVNKKEDETRAEWIERCKEKVISRLPAALK